MSLRERLLASYLLLLAVALGVIAVALLLLLSTRPAPPQPTLQALAFTVQGNLRELLPGPGNGRGLLDVDGGLEARLARFAEAHGVRTLVLQGRDQSVLFDSANVYSGGAVLRLRPIAYTIPPFRQTLQRAFALSLETAFVGFSDPDGTEWLALSLSFSRPGQAGVDVLFADAQPSQSLAAALAEFGTVLPTLFQAAFVGLMVAIVLAVLISRTIARTLQNVARAADAVAGGHYDQRVPVSGPPEVQAVAQAFNHMSAQVRATHQAQQDFLANVSHDLKTPLTSIQGYAQAIMDGTAKDPAGAASIIYEEASRLNRMVVELTDLTRLQAGRLSMKAAPVDMGQVAAVGQRLSVVAREKGVALHVETDAMPLIAGDGDRLAQVLTNLISNAINYTPPGGQVWVKTLVNNGGVEVVVQDTGIGIPAEELPRIFERFYQVDKARGPRRGTGLGLAITREIVQAHGGRITVTSPGVNQGSTFTVWLPSPHLSTIVRGKV